MMRELAADEIHVWTISLHRPAHESDRDTDLSPDEQNRAGRLRRPEDRLRFVAAHVAQRRILADYCGRPPSELRLVRNPFGKPSLEDVPWLRFSMARSADRALVAVARDAEVGIDIEKLRPMENDFIASSGVASPAEEEILRRASGEDRDRVFLQLWTRKEALIKAWGIGLSAPVQEITVLGEDLVSADPLVMLSSRGVRGTWRIFDLAPDAAYCAALAAPDTAYTIREHAYHRMDATG